MNYPSKPQKLSNFENTEYPIDEYKTLVEERRFIMTRYMQAIALYLALIAYSLKEIITKNGSKLDFLLLAFLFIINLLAFYGATKFRSMAIFILNREAIIADKYKMQRPHSIVWGYWLAVITIFLLQIMIVSIYFIK